MQSDSHPTRATLAPLAANGADAARIADLAVSTWRGIDDALSPIIGQRGVAALFNRSLYLTRTDHPCLTPVFVQRYIEVDSRLQRVLAVVKVRASAHSSELRLFHIDGGGVRIGEMLEDYEGLLGGRPTRRAPQQDRSGRRSRVPTMPEMRASDFLQ